MIDRDVLARYLAGESSPEEVTRVRKWLDEHPAMRAQLTSDEAFPQDYAELRNAAAERFLLRLSDREPTELQRSDEPNEQQHLSGIASTPRADRPAVSRTLRRNTKTTQIALAVFALLIAVAAVRQFMLDDPAPTEYATLAGQHLEIELPDGSTAELNVASRIVVGPDFGATNRTLYLQGEAFFDVERNPNIPFVVVANAFHVEVLGTEFNVSAYHDEPQNDVAVAEGTVSVRLGAEPAQNGRGQTGATPAGGESVILNTGQAAVIDGGSLNVVRTDVAASTAWRTGTLVFRGAPITEVERRFERWYATEVVVADDVPDSLRLDATFENRSLEDAASMIAAALGLAYERLDERITFRSAGR